MKKQNQNKQRRKLLQKNNIQKKGNNNMSKKIISTILTILMVISCSITCFTTNKTVFEAQSAEAIEPIIEANITDYISMGTYNNNPVIWKVLEKKNDGSLVLITPQATMAQR